MKNNSFYCGLVVHKTDAIMDTRAQKMNSHSALQNRYLHMTHTERSKRLLQHHNCVVIHPS